jgi:hypothetical protein
MNSICVALILVIMAGVFGVATLTGIKTGRLPSKNGRITKECSAFLFWTCGILMAGISAFLVVGAAAMVVDGIKEGW